MVWKVTTLGETVDLFDSRRVPLNSRQRAERQGPYPYYGAQGIIDFVDDYLFEGRYLLVPEDGENLNSRKLPIAFFAEGRFWVNNHAHVLRGKAGIADDEFLKHWLNNTDISGFVTGAAQPKLSQANLRRIAVRLPPIETQRRIGSILSAYDDLVDNNTRRIAILEEVVRRLYQKWFVHFRIPGREPIRLAESEAGRLPEGWQVVTVGEIASVVRGRSYRGVDLVDEGGVPFVNLKCIDRGGGFRKGGVKGYAGLFKEAQTVRAGDIVIAVTDMTQERRIVAHCGRVPRLKGDCAVISMDLVKVIPKPDIPVEFLYSFLRWSGFSEEVRQHANGTNVLHLNPDHILRYRLALPTELLIQRFGAAVAASFALMDVLGDQTDMLRVTRDQLLPKLMSGEINVNTAPMASEVAAA